MNALEPIHEIYQLTHLQFVISLLMIPSRLLTCEKNYFDPSVSNPVFFVIIGEFGSGISESLDQDTGGMYIKFFF